MREKQTRQEQFTDYTATLRERFDKGVLLELQGLPQWVVWKAEIDKDGKKKKAPYNPSFHLIRASVKIPKSWGTLQEALQALETGNYSGVGLMLAPPLVFLDLDNCFDSQEGKIIYPKVEEIVKNINSYTEVSPSSRGLHILCYGLLPGKGIHSEIEMYGQNRFTTITTDHLDGTPKTLEHRQEAIAALYRQFAPPVVPEIIQNTRGVGGCGNGLTQLPEEAVNDPVLQRLLAGDIAQFGNDHSRADFVLIMKLLHWTGDNLDLTRELFLSSPLGKRAKVIRPTGITTYVDMTIYNVLKKRRNPPLRR